MIDAQVLLDAGSPQWFVDTLQRLARGAPTELDPLLVSVGGSTTIDGTSARFRCHFVRRDANQRPMVHALARTLANQVVDYCIPRSRVLQASKHFEVTGSTERLMQLRREAADLFTALQNSGEGGELMLFLLLERVLGIPQILCKMSLKTNSQMHVHGSDGVHATALPNGHLALYWCESKLYADAGAAIRACLDGVAPFLLDAGGGPTNRDLHLIRDHLDMGNDLLDELLVRYFVEGSLEASMREVRGASLIGFTLDEYPNPFEADGQTVAEEVAESIAAWTAGVQDRVNLHQIGAFEIEVFCLPMPSVDAFRTALHDELTR